MRVEPHVIGVGHVGQALFDFEIGRVENLERSIVAVGDEQFVAFGEEQDALRFGHAFDAVKALASCEIDYFDSVITQSGYEDAVGFDVNGEVVKTSFDARERDGLDEVEGGLRADGKSAAP